MKCVKGATGPFLDRLYGAFRIDLQNIYPQGSLCRMRMEERLANLITDNILPRLVPELEMLSWRRTHVLAVHVYPSAGRPHYLKRAGLERSVYVRVGSTNRYGD